MASLYFTQYRRRAGLATAGPHGYRSQYDSATKLAAKRRLGVVPMTQVGVPPAVPSQLSVDELREVKTKPREGSAAKAQRLRAGAELVERGQLP
jgi:hypothetical protein